MDVAAIILAGGRGTRLQAVVADRPKPLALVAGRPFVTYLLDQLADAGVRRVVLSTGYLAEQFADALGDDYGELALAYAQESEPLGTGGAIAFASRFADADALLVMNGDSYFDVDLSRYLQWHQRRGNDASLLLVETPDASRYGTVELGDDERVTAFHEKRPGAGPGLINAGAYVISRRLVDAIPARPALLEREVFPRWIAEFVVRGHAVAGEFLDIGVPEDYVRSHDFMTRVTR